jgi:Uma2 family endonuclease
MARLAPGLVRIPDVTFISWSKLPDRKLPDEPIWSLAPDLAMEVISRGNTKKEMDRKLHDYFTAGTRLVWYVYPDAREVHVYTAPDSQQVVKEPESLSGGDVLPGFSLDLRDLFGA